jgi:chemotaxis signal transduction protein
MAGIDGAQQLAVFSLGEEEYALPITRVQVVVTNER